jgi:hypothetical protein
MPVPLLPAIGSFITANAPSILAGAASVGSTLMTNRANKRSTERAYLQNMNMWEKQLEYNTPNAQMQRYQDAGLNPHLIYSQGNAGNATEAPQLGYQPYQAPSFNDAYLAASTSSKLALNQQSIENMRSQMLKRAIDVEYLDKSMQDRLAILKSTLSGRDLNNRLLGISRSRAVAELRNYLRSMNYNGQNLILQTMDAGLQRAYNSNQAITLDNVKREIEIDLRRKGINPNSSNWLETALRLFFRNTGVPEDGIIPSIKNNAKTWLDEKIDDHTYLDEHGTPAERARYFWTLRRKK